MDWLYAIVDRIPDWHKRARCRFLEPAQADRLFFPTAGQPSNRALAYCQNCPVVRECRQAGKGEEYGVWGGGLALGRKTREAQCETQQAA